jgi:hypothetical protein
VWCCAVVLCSGAVQFMCSAVEWSAVEWSGESVCSGVVYVVEWNSAVHAVEWCIQRSGDVQCGVVWFSACICSGAWCSVM